jgi:membrane protein
MGKALRSFGRLIKRLFRPLAPFGRLLKEAVIGFITHNVSRMAASIAYFGAFSLAPILVIMVTLASLVFGEAASEGLIVDRLSHTFGDSTARFIQSMLASIYNNSGGLTVATVLAILLLMWASTRIIGAVRGALNDIWGVPGHGGTGFLGFVFGKLIDLGFVIVIGVMFLAAMLANTAVSALTGYFSDILPMPGWVLQIVGIVFSLVVTTIFLTIIFRFLPNIKVRLVYILLGAAVTAVLFSIGNYVIGRYLGRTSPGSTFGAAGSLAVIMIWMYYSAYIVLFGAEVTRAYALRGKLKTATEAEGHYGLDGASDDGTAIAQPAAFEGIPPEARDDLPEDLGDTRPSHPA